MTSLKDKLTQATSRFFGSAPKEVAVPFELLCDCGHRVAGIRKLTDQTVHCSACRAPLYVLPNDPYPVIRNPRAVSKDVSVPPRGPDRVQPPASDSSSSSEEEKDHHDSRHGSGRAPLKEESSRRKPDRKQSSRGEAQVESPAIPLVEELPAIPKTSLGERLKRWFAPTRVLAMGLVVLVIGTSWWVLQQRRAEAARKAWRREMDLVEPALKNGDFDVLYSALNKAVDAARVLNRRDAEVLEAESLLAQTNAVRTLSDVDLFAALAGTLNEQGIVDDVKARDAVALLQGQRLIFDTTFSPASVRTEQLVSQTVRLMELDCALSIQSTPVQLEIASASLTDFIASSPSASVIFTASIRSVIAPQAVGESWEIELDGDSVVFITTPLHAKMCGLDVSVIEGLEGRLDQQRVFVRGKSADSEVSRTVPTEEKPAAEGGKP